MSWEIGFSYMWQFSFECLGKNQYTIGKSIFWKEKKDAIIIRTLPHGTGSKESFE